MSNGITSLKVFFENVGCWAKSPDFESIPICHYNFITNMKEMLVLVEFNNGYEVGRLRTALDSNTIFCFLGRLRMAGRTKLQRKS